MAAVKAKKTLRGLAYIPREGEGRW